LYVLAWFLKFSMSATSSPLAFAPLSEAALSEFSDARNFVTRVVDDLLGGEMLTQTSSDLGTLQTLVDHDAMRNANYEAWVALGIAFGDALADHVPGLAWRLVTDQNRTYAALQYAQTALSVAAPTMLWKRVERGENFDLVDLASGLKTFIDEHAHEYRQA
jgi:hypothetical protein